MIVDKKDQNAKIDYNLQSIFSSYVERRREALK